MSVPLPAGLFAIARIRTPGRDTAALIDAALGTLRVGVLAAVFLLPSHTAADVHPLSVVQPLLGVLMLGVVLRVGLAGGRPQPSLLFGAGAVVNLMPPADSSSSRDGGCAGDV